MYESAGVLKYEFRVRPGGRVSDIRLAYAGAKGLALGAAGALRIQTGVGVLRDSAPVSYQTITGRQVPVSSRYLLEAGGKSKAPQFAFDVGSYQRDHELVIDPGVQFTTFLGGNGARDRRRHRRRRQRQLLHRRHDPVAQLPDHDRGVQAHRRDQQLR